MLLSSNTSASDLDKYAKALDWQKKWQRVINVQADKYVNKTKPARFSQLPEEKQKEIAARLKERLERSFHWNRFGTQVSQSFVDSCGTELLDKFVDYSSGREISAYEREKISQAYKVCGTSAVEKSMVVINSTFERLDESKTARKGFLIEVAGIIIIRQKAFQDFKEKYLAAKGYKAFAQSESGNWNWRSNRTSKDHAINNALASCRSRNQEYETKQPCRIINLENEWVDIYRQSLLEEQKNEAVLMSKKALKSFEEKFVNEIKNKAFAQSTNGSWSWKSSKTSKDDAIEKALSSCRKINRKHERVFPCRVVNVNGNWLLGSSSVKESF